MTWAPDAAAAVREQFVANADPERAAQMAKYMKDHFVFFGIPSAPRRALARAAMQPLGRPGPADALAFAELAWQQSEREMQYVGVDVLTRIAGKFDRPDLPRVRSLVENRSWWDTVDALASHVIGTMVHNHRELANEMDRWIDDPDIWVARVAILHQLRWKGDTDQKRLFTYCTKRAGDTEFFLRKAIGWALREHAKVQPDEVRDFVDANEDVLSGLSKREARKHL